jgi:hypothetical protein
MVATAMSSESSRPEEFDVELAIFLQALGVKLEWWRAQAKIWCPVYDAKNFLEHPHVRFRIERP